VNPYKIKVVKQIYLGGVLYSKPEKAARAYTEAQCADWWQVYLIANRKSPASGSGYLFRPAHHIDAGILRERKARMYRRVLPIFKRMLQQE